MKSRIVESPSIRSHRSLTRTEHSQHKLQQKRQRERLKTLSAQSHQSPPPNDKNTHPSMRLQFLKEITSSQNRKSRTKSGRKIIGIFRKAHQIKEDQSFLNKIPKQRAKILNNKQIRSIFKAERSEMIRTISSMDNTSPKNKKDIENETNRTSKYTKGGSLLSPQAKFRAISNAGYSKTYTPQEMAIFKHQEERAYSPQAEKIQNKTIVTESIPKSAQKQVQLLSNPISQLKQRAQPSRIIEASHIIQQRISQNKIPTVRKQFRHYSKEIDQKHANQTSEKVQMTNTEDLSNVKPEVNDKKAANTITKNYDPSQINLDNLKTIEPTQKMMRQPSPKKRQGNEQKKGSNSKRQYYSNIYGEVDVVDIEEIELVSSPQKDKKPKPTVPSERIDNAQEKPADWNGHLQRAKLENNPYLPIESNKKQDINKKLPKQISNIERKSSLDNKASQKSAVKSHQGKKQSNTKPLSQIRSSSMQSGKIDVQKRKNSDINQKNDQHMREIDEIKADGNKEKEKILQVLNKITKMHSRLELLGQLATYFSKSSKSLKPNQQNKSFIRSQSISWQFMIYLFFKYFYYMLLLFSKYYQFSAMKVPIRKSQLDELKAENEKWSQTLQKIQKSVRKNLKPNQYDQNYFQDTNALLDLQQPQKVNGLITQYFLFKKCEQNNFREYMKILASKIYKEVTSYVRSMNLSNILTIQSPESLIFQQSAFRVFNSTIILYQLQNPTQPQMTTCDNIEQLDKPPLEKFKQYYEKLTKEILSKK